MLIGITWNTGNESLPSYIPRVDRITLMKWMQVFRSSGNDEDLVSSLTSATEMLPTTLEALSRTAREDTPSLSSKVNASERGLSPLCHR